MLSSATLGLAAPVYDGLYLLDGYGNIHTVDSAPVIPDAGIDWGWDIARDIALTGNETGTVDGMYLLSGYGDVSGFGNANLFPSVDRPYWGWDIARDVEPAPDWTTVKNGISGFYILDGFGGVFPVGDLSRPYFKIYGATIWDISSQSEVDGYVYWGWDVAEDLEVSVVYDEAGQVLRTNGYYILDAYGGVHWCLENGLGNVKDAPWGFTQPYFGWDIARGFEMTPTFKGYVMVDGYGGVHAVGDAAASFPSQTTPYFGFDIVKDIELVYDETQFSGPQGLVVLDGYGGLHTDGNVTVQNPPPMFVDEDDDPWDIARDMELSPFFTFVSDAVVTGS